MREGWGREWDGRLNEKRQGLSLAALTLTDARARRATSKGKIDWIFATAEKNSFLSAFKNTSELLQSTRPRLCDLSVQLKCFFHLVYLLREGFLQ